MIKYDLLSYDLLYHWYDLHLKISEDYQRLANISEQSSKIFRSYRNKFRFVQQLSFVNLIAHMTSLMSSHVKISCFQSKRNPSNSLKLLFKAGVSYCYYDIAF